MAPKRKSTPTKDGSRPNCSCVTLKNKPCSRKVSQPGKKYCTQHKACRRPATPIDVVSSEKPLRRVTGKSTPKSRSAQGSAHLAPALPRVFRRREGSIESKFEDVYKGDWRPVTEWEVLCHQASEEQGHLELRRMMSESICRLAKSGRELLYQVVPERTYVDSFAIALAVVTAEVEGRGDHLPYFYPTDALNFVHRSLRGRAQIEAAVMLEIKRKEVFIWALNRNLTFKSLPVEVASPKSKVVKVMLCFALAMAGEICMSLARRNMKVVLEAVDEGSGKLLQYYGDEYGLRRLSSAEMRSGKFREHWGSGKVMFGDLASALEKCGRVWAPSEGCQPCRRRLRTKTNPEAVSKLKQATDFLERHAEEGGLR